MFLTVHAAVGSLIGEQINNPALAFILAFISHFTLDTIPHGDHDWTEEYENKTNKKKIKKIINLILLDIAGLLIFLFFLYSSKTIKPLNFAAGVIGAILPDFLVGSHYLTKKFFKKFYAFHSSIHGLINYNISLKKGFFFQTIFLAIILIIMFS